MAWTRLSCVGTAALALTTGLSAQSFTDVTNDSGLGGAHVVAPLTAHFQIMTDSVAVGDYDGDGWDDIFWHGGSGQSTKLFRNDQRGAFIDVTEAAGVGVMASGAQALWFDADDDGDLDLLLTTIEDVYPGPVAMLPGGGTLTGPNSPAGVDLSPGPKLQFHRNYFWRNDGDGTFTESAEEAGLLDSGYWGVAAGDINGDGLVDLVGVSWSLPHDGPRPINMLLNQGDGTFRDRTPVNIKTDPANWAHGFSPHIVDIDGDGDKDVLWAGDFDTSTLLRNDGNMTFVNTTVAAGFGTDENGMGSTIADFDGDNDLDVFVSAIYNDVGPLPEPNWGWSGNRLYVNNGDGTFTDGTDAAGVRDGGWGWGAQWADIDNNRFLDLLHTNGWPMEPTYPEYLFDTTRAFMNDGFGNFTDEAASMGLVEDQQGRGLVVFDYNRDGALDVLTSSNDVGLQLWKNDPATVGRWIEIEARTGGTNSHAVGTRITLTIPGNTRYLRELECSDQFMSQAPTRAWFGLGQYAGAVDLELVWPDGQSTHVYGVTTMQRVTISKPAPATAGPPQTGRAGH